MNVCSKFQFNRSYRQTLLPVTARQKITKRRKQIKPQAQQPRCRFGPGDDFEKTAFSEHLELGGFRAVRETVPVWVKSGSGRGVGRFCPNSGNDLLGTVSDLYKRNPPFSQLLRCKNGGFAGRSVGIRTRGLLDPNSVREKNSSNMRPLWAIVCMVEKKSNYCVHTVHPLLSYSGSRFGSVEFTVPPKSEFWELLKVFPFRGELQKLAYRNSITVRRIGSIPPSNN